MSHRNKAYVYHLSHVDNLGSIIVHGLQARRNLAALGIRYTDIADPEILNGRSDYDLDSFVPFHFLPKSPFDCAVVRASADPRFVLFAVRRELAMSREWRVIPQHPLADGRRPVVLSWEEGMGRIDWVQMDKFPRNYHADHTCKMTCMAEALSPKPVPLSEVAAIYTASSAVAQAVRAQVPRRVHVNVNPQMLPPGCQ